jgi:hypothetical protein
MHFPKQSHEDALQRIGWYLKGTLGKGLIFNPSESLKINCYPDADFAGLWNRDNKQDPHCVRSRTGYVICLADCLVLCKSTLQTEVAGSTMEAEYVALSTSCCNLFPLTDVTRELSAAFSIELLDTAQMHVEIHKNNVGGALWKIGTLPHDTMLQALHNKISLVP